MTAIDAPAGIRLSTWLELFRRDYLESFIGSGGAAVKVLVTDRTAIPDAADRIQQVARSQGFLAVHVAGETDKLHTVDRLFREVAAQLDWNALAADFVSAGFRSRGYTVPPEGVAVELVAKASDKDLTVTKGDFRDQLSKGLMPDRVMSKDFKLAMLQLCRAAGERDDLNLQRAALIREWLAGRLPRISALKDCFIFEKVNRHNARALVASTGAWVRTVGRAGLVVTVDVSRYALAHATQTPGGETLKAVSRGAAMDAYELMREFIDSTDELVGTCIVFLTGNEFLEDPKRGYQTYPALHLRLVDDVRDRTRANPLAAMVRVER